MLNALVLLVCLSDVTAARVQAKSKMTDRGNSMIAKVIEMLGDEKDKIKADLAEEATTFAEFTTWCDDTSTELSYGIKTSKAKIEDLTALIEDNTAQIAALDEELAELGNEIAERTTELEEGIEIRAKEKEEFLKAEAAQEASVEELEQLEVALKKQMQAFAETPPPVEEGAALVQTNADAPQQTFDAFVQVGHKHHRKKGFASFAQLDVSSPAFDKIAKALAMMVNSFWAQDAESQQNLKALENNGAFIQTSDAQDPMAAQMQRNEENLAAFEGLKGKAEEALQKMRDEEAKKQADHNVQVGELKMAIVLAEDNVDDAKKEKAKLGEEKATAENELGEVKASLEADSKKLKETQHECQEGAVAWETRNKEASAEMAAIEKAKQILAERVTVLIQTRSRTRVADVSSLGKEQKVRQSLINHFRGLGNRLHSLAMLNLVSLAAQDPMENVKNLLKELIGKLEKEAAEAASLHQFCQEEKNKTKEAMKKSTMTIEKLDTRLEKAETTKQELEETIAANSEELAALDKGNAEATKIRNEEHATFVKVDADFTGAAEAVDDAIDALKEYYGDASFLQTDSETETTSSDSAGGSKSAAAGGIMSILETMGEEFRRTVKENQATEREAVKAFEAMQGDDKVVKATKEAEIKAAESQIKMIDVSLNESGEDKKMALKEKAAIEEYIEKLKPQCQGRVVPYAERKAKREAEIAGLKEGLAILEADAPAGAVAFLQLQSKTRA